ncbi:hypothetical protein GCM10022206_44850 [Streptomyces chiangmaiensis]
MRSTRPVEVILEVGCALAALMLNRAMLNSPEFHSVPEGGTAKDECPSSGVATDFSQMRCPLRYTGRKPTTGFEPATF